MRRLVQASMVRWSTLMAVLGLVFCGCDRPQGQARHTVTTTTTRPVTAPAQPVARNPATAPATQPAYSTLLVAGAPLRFPRTRLLLQDAEPRVILLLFSDDPRDALHPDYTGNRYYFEIKLDIDDVSRLTAADWHFKAASIERVDSPNGIFLNGDQIQLQPYEVDIAFGGGGSQIQMNLAGQFLLFKADEQGPPRTVWVQGALSAELQTRRRIGE